MPWPLYLWSHRDAMKAVNDALRDAYYSVERMRDRSARQNTFIGEYKTLSGRLSSHIQTLQRARNVPGIAAYIKDQYPGLDVAFDPIAELTAVAVSLVNLRNELVDRLETAQVREITPSMAQPFRALCDTFLQTLDAQMP